MTSVESFDLIFILACYSILMFVVFLDIVISYFIERGKKKRQQEILEQKQTNSS